MISSLVPTIDARDIALLNKHREIVLTISKIEQVLEYVFW
jgi:hypothetical protein